MGTRRNSQGTSLKFRRETALFAALIALAIGTAAPLASSAATSAGQLYAFGENDFGQLGSTSNNGTPKPNPTPTLVNLPGATGSVTEVAAGGSHSLALTSSDQLYAFGSNSLGQLGNATNSGTINPNPTPTLVTLPGANGPVSQIAGGSGHSLTLTSSGQLYAFGFNRFGQLGSTTNNATFEPTPTPTQVSLPIGASGPVTQIAAGNDHSLALTSTGQLYAFGYNRYGQLGSATNAGSGTPNPTPLPVSLPGASGPVTQIAAGADHSLALTSTGQLYAFGENFYGQLGSATNAGTGNANPTPRLVSLPGAGGPVTMVAAGANHSLALTSTGQLYAFGYNRYGQLGNTTNDGTDNPSPTPTLVTLPGASGPLAQIAAGGADSLALTASGQLYAFGQNEYGQLGSATNSGTENPSPTPALVDLPAGTTIDTVAPGSSAAQTLALIADLTVTSGALPGGRVGTSYSAGGTAEGGTTPYVWQGSGLPAGLSIDAASGQISGTPTTAGTAQVLLSVSDKFGIAAQSAPLALRIAAPPAINRLRQSHRRWREGSRLAKLSSAVRGGGRGGGHPPIGTTFTFKLNEEASVRLSFARRKGRRFKNAGAVSFTGHPGTNRVVFQGRVSRHKTLKPGTHRLTVTASAEGSRSPPRSLSFIVVR